MNWIFFPRTNEIPKFLVKTISIFEKYEKKIDSRQRNNSKNRLDSDSVLKILTPDLLKLGFKVEKSKKKEDKVIIPVLFGNSGRRELTFEADAYHKKYKTVIEVEAGRALVNYQFLKDIFQASMMVDTDYLVLAVRNLYNQTKDFEKISKFIETMYLTRKIQFDLKGILLIGY